MTKTANQTRFTIADIKEFLAELNLIKSIVKGKNTIPVLDCVKMEVENGKLTLTGTDLDNTLISRISVNQSLPGAFVVHLKTFLDAVRTAKREISVDVTQIEKEFNAGTKETPEMQTVQDVSMSLMVDGAAFSIEGVDAEQFPEMLSDDICNPLGEISATVLQELLSKTVFNITQEQSRFSLCAVAMEFGKTGLRIIGTDGHRAGYAETKDFIEIKPSKTKIKDTHYPDAVKNYLLNSNAAKVLQKASYGKVSISEHENTHSLIFKFGARSVIARMPAGNFPNYRMVLPKESEFSFNFHPKELLPVIKNALTFANERTKTVAFQPYYNNFVVKSNGGEKSFTGKATCDFPQNSAPGMLCNGQFLADICNVMDGEVLRLNYVNTGQQFDITGENELSRFRFVIMPLHKEGEQVETYQILTPDEKPNFPMVPFYKTVSVAKPAKVDKKSVRGEIESLLSELRAIAGIDGMPGMFTEITGEIVQNLAGKIKLLG